MTYPTMLKKLTTNYSANDLMLNGEPKLTIPEIIAFSRSANSRISLSLTPLTIDRLTTIQAKMLEQVRN